MSKIISTMLFFAIFTNTSTISANALTNVTILDKVLELFTKSGDALRNFSEGIEDSIRAATRTRDHLAIRKTQKNLKLALVNLEILNNMGNYNLVIEPMIEQISLVRSALHESYEEYEQTYLKYRSQTGEAKNEERLKLEAKKSYLDIRSDQKKKIKAITSGKDASSGMPESSGSFSNARFVEAFIEDRWTRAKLMLQKALATVTKIEDDLASEGTDFVDFDGYPELLRTINGRKKFLDYLSNLPSPATEQELVKLEAVLLGYIDLHKELKRLNRSLKEYVKLLDEQ